MIWYLVWFVAIGLLHLPKKKEEYLHSLQSLSDFINTHNTSTLLHLSQLPQDMTMGKRWKSFYLRLFPNSSTFTLFPGETAPSRCFGWIRPGELQRDESCGASAETERPTRTAWIGTCPRAWNGGRWGRWRVLWSLGVIWSLLEKCSAWKHRRYSNPNSSRNLRGCLALARVFSLHQTVFEGVKINISNSLVLRNKVFFRLFSKYWSSVSYLGCGEKLQGSVFLVWLLLSNWYLSLPVTFAFS